MDAAELHGWMDYERTEQIGWRPDWLRTSALAAVLVNRLRWGGEPIPLDALVPGGASGRPAADDGPEERAAKVRAGGGLVLTPPPIPKG